MEDVTYIVLFLATTAYALVLEQFRRNRKRTYMPRWTWVTVVIGVAIVGAFVALRLLLFGAPTLAPMGVAWWMWRVWFWHFVAGGLPIVLWQLIVDRRDIEAALRAATKG